jgi:hypothetical protein
LQMPSWRHGALREGMPGSCSRSSSSSRQAHVSFQRACFPQMRGP